MDPQPTEPKKRGRKPKVPGPIADPLGLPEPAATLIKSLQDQQKSASSALELIQASTDLAWLRGTEPLIDQAMSELEKQIETQGKKALESLFVPAAQAYLACKCALQAKLGPANYTITIPADVPASFRTSVGEIDEGLLAAYIRHKRENNLPISIPGVQA